MKEITATTTKGWQKYKKEVGREGRGRKESKREHKKACGWGT